MEGSLKQLAYSNYLIDETKSKISFFKHNYHNYSKFVFDTRPIPFGSAISFGSSTTIRLDTTATYGDLINGMVIEVELPNISAILTSTGYNIGYANGIGNILLEWVELRINSELIDRQTGLFYDIWSSLSIPAGGRTKYRNLIKKFDTAASTNYQGGSKIYIPLMFWFCRNTIEMDSTMVFPLAALYNQTVELKFKFAPFNKCIISDDGSFPISVPAYILAAQLLIDYVTVDDSERKMLQSQSIMPRNYLLTQTNVMEESIVAGTTSTVINLRQFNYLMTELIIVARIQSAVTYNDHFNYSNTLSSTGKISPIKRISIKFDGSDKYYNLDAAVFSDIGALKYHTTSDDQFINVISFSLYPEKFEQPSGVCNYSEIHDVLLILELNTGLPALSIFVYSINYNILRFVDNSATLLHSMSRGIPTELKCV